jgi:hypothetical protein
MAVAKEVHELIGGILKKTTGDDKPVAEHKLVYDSTSETLEPLYFFILDLVESFGFEVEKLVDNFASSPGSGHFAEFGTRATRMQEEAMKILGSVNAVLKSILNITYDLKDMRARLKSYDDLHARDKDTRSAARLSLKQIWLDKVDIQKGNSSIKAMAIGQAGFQTLLDAFLAADTPKEAEQLDLNERVKRIVQSRVEEFNTWLAFSEQELRKRYDLEKNYLRSQLSSMQLYARWSRPYLKAAAELTMKEYIKSADIVKAFNTLLLELTLFGKREFEVNDGIASGDLSPEYAKIKMRRKYYSCILVDFYFRGIPQRIGQQGFAFGGRAEVTFRAYVLNEDEIEMLEKVMENSDFEAALQLIGYADESLKALESDINEFLEEETPTKAMAEHGGGANPFLALLGAYEKKEEKKEAKKEKKKKEKKLSELKDTWIEQQIRNSGKKNAIDSCFQFFDIYKKAHGMASYT